MKTIAIIPARNEAATIGPIVSAIRNSGAVSKVIVVLDADTTDKSADIAETAGAHKILAPNITGKGELMTIGVNAAASYGCDRIMFCDADYEGMNREHVRLVCQRTSGMTLGVPEYPHVMMVPARVITHWHAVTGFRSVPFSLVYGHDLYGYLAETQINRFCRINNIPIFIERMMGLWSEYNWSEDRNREYLRDRKRGRELGILP